MISVPLKIWAEKLWNAGLLYVSGFPFQSDYEFYNQSLQHLLKLARRKLHLYDTEFVLDYGLSKSRLPLL
jgi:hypothetical protein